MTEMDPATSSLCSWTQWLACLPQLHTRWFAHAQLHRQLIVCFNLTTTSIVHIDRHSHVWTYGTTRGMENIRIFSKISKASYIFGRKYQIHISHQRYISEPIYVMPTLGTTGQYVRTKKCSHMRPHLFVHSCHTEQYIIIILRLVIHTVTATQSVREQLGRLLETAHETL